MPVRRVETRDAQPLSGLIVQNLRQVNSRDYAPEAIEALVLLHTPEKLAEYARSQLTLVCTREDDVVGTASLDGDRVRNVFVAVARHGQGIGRELMRAIEAHARERGVEKLYLLSGLTASGFYERLGYRIVRRFENDLDGIPLPVIQMDKELVGSE